MILDLDLELAAISCYTKSTFEKGGAKYIRQSVKK